MNAVFIIKSLIEKSHTRDVDMFSSRNVRGDKNSLYRRGLTKELKVRGGLSLNVCDPFYLKMLWIL